MFLFAVCFPRAEARKNVRIVFWSFLVGFATLNFIYIIRDFITSHLAVQNWKYGASTSEWTISDRDFGLLTTGFAMRELTLSGGSPLRPLDVEEVMLDVGDEEGRDLDIKIGVAADFLALVLAVIVFFVAVIPGLRKKVTAVEEKGLGSGTVSSTFI